MAVAVTAPEQIQAEMQRVRTEMRADMKEMVAGARDLTDWRHYVRSAPWLTLGAAAAVGYMLVPSRTVIVRPAAQDLLELAKAQKLVVNVDSKATKKQTLLGTLAGMAVGAIVQGGLAIATQQIDQFLKNVAAGPPPVRPVGPIPTGKRHD
jgi:hypothetical protein